MTTTTDAETKGYPTRVKPVWVRIVNTASNVLGAVAGIFVLAMAVQVLIDVTGRTLFNSPLPGTLEMTSYWWMPALIFLSWGAAELNQEHLRVTLALDSADEGLKRTVGIATSILSMMVIAVLVYFAFEAASISVGYAESAAGAIPVPIWPAKILAVVGVGMLLLQTAVSLWEYATHQRAMEFPEEIAAEIVSEKGDPS